MRLLLASSVVALLSVGTGACGGASKGTDTPLQTSSDAAGGGAAAASTARAAPPGGYLKNDGDSDNDDNGHSHKGPDTSDVGSLLKEFRYKADRADTRAIATLVKSYYAAAAAGDGTKACSLLGSSLATGFVESQDQSAPGSGRSCAASLSLLFKQQHGELASDEVATMVVTAVRVKGELGLAELGFRAAPEAEIVLEREGRAWKLGALFDSKLP